MCLDLATAGQGIEAMDFTNDRMCLFNADRDHNHCTPMDGSILLSILYKDTGPVPQDNPSE